jgi:hypothetical protein
LEEERSRFRMKQHWFSFGDGCKILNAAGEIEFTGKN